MLNRGLIRLTAALVTCLPITVIAAPDKIYVNGNVITVDEQFSIANSFAIKDDKFSAVGSSDKIIPLADQETEIIDLQGRTVIPGLIDNHNHFIRGANYWSNSVRLDGIDSRAEALRLLQEHTEQLGEDEWLLVLGGWNQEQFADEPRGFTRAELDEIAGKRPAFIQAQYSHAFVNSAFLKLIDAPIKSTSEPSKTTTSAIDKLFGPPLKQLVVRDEQGIATSRLNGGMGMVLQVSTLMPPPSKETVLSGVIAAQKHYNALGITSIYDPAGALASEPASDAVEKLHSNKALSIRVFRTASLSALDTEMIKRVLKLRILPDWLESFILDRTSDVESTAEAIAALDALPPMQTGDDYYDHIAIGEVLYVPIHDTLDSHITPESITEHHRTEAQKLLENIISRGLSAQIHAVNTETLATYLDIFEQISVQHPLARNQITLTHAEGVNQALLKRIKDLGISLQARSMLVVRNIKQLESDHGSEILSKPPLRTIEESGVAWGLGTDGSKASQIEPFRTLHWAITGQAINGDKILNQHQLLSRQEALIAHTRSNAYLLNRDDKLGQIQPGYLADFVVLDKNYLTIDAEQIASIEVIQTVVGGNTVYNQEK